MEGIVKWYNEEKGYGFIVDENGNDLFVHFSEILDVGYKVLHEDELVSFVEIKQGTLGDKAIGIRRKALFSPDNSVALVYSEEDEETIWRLFFIFRISNIDVYLFNEKNLMGSDDEDEEETITFFDALSDINLVAICVSTKALKNDEFMQTLTDLDLGSMQTNGHPQFFILKLDDCKTPDPLSDYKSLNIFEADGPKNAIQFLKKAMDAGTYPA